MSWAELEESLLEVSRTRAAQAVVADACRCGSDDEVSSVSNKSHKSSPYFQGSLSNTVKENGYQMPLSAPWWAKLFPLHTAHLLPQSGLQQFRAASPLKLVSGCTASFAEAAVLKVPAECCERNVLIWNLAWILQAVASANVFCLAVASPFVSFCLPGVWDQLSLLVVL